MTTVQTTPRKIRRYGWKPDLPDHRDLHLQVTAPKPLPPVVDWRPKMTFPVYDQDALGSCTANAIGAALETEEVMQGEPSTMLSRLFIYYYERLIEGTVSSDAGAEIRDGIKVVAKIGAPPETLWPYDIAKFADKPPQAAYDAAKAHRAISYYRVRQTNLLLRQALVIAPVVIGFTVYESFESDEVAKTGMVPMPSLGEQALGGHAVLIAGYDTNTRRYLVRNSWGAGWGLGGYFTIPFDYFENPQLASDAWTVRRVT